MKRSNPKQKRTKTEMRCFPDGIACGSHEIECFLGGIGCLDFREFEKLNINQTRANFSNDFMENSNFQARNRTINRLNRYASRNFGFRVWKFEFRGL